MMKKKYWFIEGTVFFLAALVAIFFSVSDKYCLACFIHQDPIPSLLWSEDELDLPFREQTADKNSNGITDLLQSFLINKQDAMAIERLNLRGVPSLDQVTETWNTYTCDDVRGDWEEISANTDVKAGIYQAYWHALEAPTFFYEVSRDKLLKPASNDLTMIIILHRMAQIDIAHALCEGDWRQAAQKLSILVSADQKFMRSLSVISRLVVIHWLSSDFVLTQLLIDRVFQWNSPYLLSDEHLGSLLETWDNLTLDDYTLESSIRVEYAMVIEMLRTLMTRHDNFASRTFNFGGVLSRVNTCFNEMRIASFSPETSRELSNVCEKRIGVSSSWRDQLYGADGRETMESLVSMIDVFSEFSLNKTSLNQALVIVLPVWKNLNQLTSSSQAPEELPLP